MAATAGTLKFGVELLLDTAAVEDAAEQVAFRLVFTTVRRSPQSISRKERPMRKAKETLRKTETVCKTARC